MLTTLDATSGGLSSIGADPVQPEAAIAWFERKRRLLTKAQWLALTTAARSRAFTVAWATSAQVLTDVKASLDKALAEGQSFRDWKKGLREALAGKWQTGDAHLETIFRNNLQAAYNAGRWRAARDPLTLKLRPFWKLIVILDDRTSEHCRPLATPPVILPAEDPWWNDNYPPRHHRCRDSVVTLTKRQAAREGVLTKAPTTKAQAGWGSTAGFEDWAPDPTGYDPAIFKRAAARQEEREGAPGSAGTASSFDELARTKPLTGVRVPKLGAENVNPVFVAQLGDAPVYVKPGHANFNATVAVEKHRAVEASVSEIGGDVMVMPAAVVRSEEALREAARQLPAIADKDNAVTSTMFVTHAAPNGAVPAYAQSPATLAKVKDADRLAGAVIDFLHGNADRHDGNVLVDGRGRLVLIDHDETASGRAPSSVFFPGGGLGYKGRQARFSDLPERAQKHVSKVAGSSVKDLSRRFSLSKSEAAAMKARAKSIMSKGLDAALVEHGAGWQAIAPAEGAERFGEVAAR